MFLHQKVKSDFFHTFKRKIVWTYPKYQCGGPLCDLEIWENTDLVHFSEGLVADCWIITQTRADTAFR